MRTAWVLVFAIVVAAFGASAPVAAASPVVSTTALACDQHVGTSGPPYDGATKVLGAVWLPTRKALGSVRLDEPPAQNLRWWSKQGISIEGGSTFTLSVPRAWRGRLAIGWGSPAPPSDEVAVAGCTGAQWLAYAGGYWVDEPACVPLVVTSGTHRKVVHIGVGAACRGQSPPPS